MGFWYQAHWFCLTVAEVGKFDPPCLQSKDIQYLKARLDIYVYS